LEKKAGLRRAAKIGYFPLMPDKKSRAERREQQAREIEESQNALRNSIAETQRLMDRSDAMLARHRRECEEDDRDQ
jgi:hypothetical protein